MFKVKNHTEYPMHPKPPTWDQMIEDINFTTELDRPMLNTDESIKNDFLLQNSDINLPDVSTFGNENKKVNSVIFGFANQLVEKFDQLEMQLKNLNYAGEKLRSISDNLSDSVEKVKRQARTTVSNKS